MKPRMPIAAGRLGTIDIDEARKGVPFPLTMTINERRIFLRNLAITKEMLNPNASYTVRIKLFSMLSLSYKIWPRLPRRHISLSTPKAHQRKIFSGTTL